MINLTERGEREESLLVTFPRVNKTGFHRDRLTTIQRSARSGWISQKSIYRQKARERYGLVQTIDSYREVINLCNIMQSYHEMLAL